MKLEDDNLLVVFQTPWQRRLLDIYGKELVFLDATYKTTKYALPLFFLCVQTNSGYCVVGAFITEKEESSSIAEALQIIKDNNPTWYPGGFMIDASKVEANAINSAFQDSKLFICDFHRKQAWQRWMNTLKNDVSRQEATTQLLNTVISET
ncbi:uncharacterized protein LOC124125195 [Haliotis rufescens]|uniref:uncharacterized protein LOC124125195 n=1 Tax=Haliotis rufescens TaxID=6454 RepID=UPI00201F0C6B|nr:uncharacterized protein LOC124125195 [Haliotis rufescens]